MTGFGEPPFLTSLYLDGASQWHRSRLARFVGAEGSSGFTPIVHPGLYTKPPGSGRDTQGLPSLGLRPWELEPGGGP